VIIGLLAVAALLVVPSELSGADECGGVPAIALTRGRSGYRPDSNVHSKLANFPQDTGAPIRMLIAMRLRVGTFAATADCPSILESSCALRC
jgi:hypothetical protein